MRRAKKTVALIALPASAGEAIQHVVEIYLGMYVVSDGIAAGYESNVRLLAAAMKVLGFLLTVILTRAHLRRAVRTTETSKLRTGMMITVPLLGHYALNYLAVGKDSWIVAMLIAVDCLVIGYLAYAIGSVLPKR